MAKVKPVPDGYHTITPMLVLDDAAKAIEFWKKAFGAQEVERMPMPDGKIAHAALKIGNSMLFVSDEMPSMPGQPGVYKSPKSAGLSTASLFLYVDDADAFFDKGLKAGCVVRQKLEDMFWGDRYGQLIDPFGITWGIGTHIEDVSRDEMMRRGAQAMSQAQTQSPPPA